MIQFSASFSILGVPESGLTPTILIREEDGTIVVNGLNCTEVGSSFYIYNFNNDTSKQYFALIDGGTDSLDSRYLTACSERAKAESEIVDILADTNDLQTNQGDFTTAVGFSTHTPADVKTAMEVAGSKLTDIHDASYKGSELTKVSDTEYTEKILAASGTKEFTITKAGDLETRTPV